MNPQDTEYVAELRTMAGALFAPDPAAKPEPEAEPEAEGATDDDSLEVVRALFNPKTTTTEETS